MVQQDFCDREVDDYSHWQEAVAETAPELMPEQLPPEFSPMAFPISFPVAIKRKRRRIELPIIKRA